MFRPPVLAAVLAAAACLLPGAAEAHARLVSATPAANATVMAGVSTIEVAFNETLEPALSTLELDDASGMAVTAATEAAACGGRTCRLAVPPLKAGDYVVKYHVLSADGHVVDGSYTFHVRD